MARASRERRYGKGTVIQPAQQTVNLSLGREVAFYSESGQPVSPYVMIDRLMQDGPVLEHQWELLRREFVNAGNVKTFDSCAQSLGVIKSRNEHGEVIYKLHPDEEKSTQLADAPPTPSAEEASDNSYDEIVVHSERQPVQFAATSIPLSTASGSSLNHMQANNPNAVPLRAAQQLAGDLIGRLKIYRDHNKPHSRERFVNRIDLESLLRSQTRGSGAAETIAQEIQAAQRQRARSRYSGQPKGAAETARASVGGRKTNASQDADRKRAQAARARNSGIRRAGTDSRRKK